MQREEHERELMSVTQERDDLQEQLQIASWEREEGEGEEEKDGEGEEEREGKEEEEEEEEEKEEVEVVEVREGEQRLESGVSEEGLVKSSELQQQISLVEEMNLKATAGVKETKQKAKVCSESIVCLRRLQRECS